VKYALSLVVGLIMSTVAGGGAPAQAVNYPTKPIRLIIPFVPGGGADAVGTAISDELSKRLGQPIVKSNHPGSNSVIGTALLAKSPPDGHTLLLVTAGIASNPFLYANLPYKTPDSFAPVSILTSYPFVLGVRRDLPFNSIKEMIEFAKANPGKLRAATSGRGAAAHLTLGLLNNLSGSEIRAIPFKGAGEGLNAVAGGFVDMIFSGFETVRPFVEGGRMKYFGSSGPALTSAGIPSISDTVPGFEYLNWMAMIAPAGTPPEVLDKLNTALASVFADPTVKDRLAALNIDIIASPHKEAKEYIVQQMAVNKRIIDSLGLKPE
jgi:tripartite-type tricarboxylate transporter receptor subunit TctC